MKMNVVYSLFTLTVLVCQACYREVSIPVKADFSIKATNNNYTAPASVELTNLSVGADTYQWTFDGATPATSAEKVPPAVRYAANGSYKIKLAASNVDGERDTKEVTLTVGVPLRPTFSVDVVDNLFPPATINLRNQSDSGERVEWAFEGGSPATSTMTNPSVTFATPGPHKVSMRLYFGAFFQQKDTTIVVGADLVPAFDYQLSPDDFDGEAPLTLTTQNKTVGGVSYSWSADGAQITSPAGEATAITFPKEGTYTIKLEASNGKKSQSVTRTIVVKPNSNLFVLSDVKLGVNTAQNTIGCFVSTSQNRVYKAREVVSAKEGASIDLAFFGLNPSFTYNRFISPTEAGNLTFDEIPGAQAVRYVNVLENCQDCPSLSSVQFDQLKDDSLLKTWTIPDLGETVGFSSKQVPRLVLFQTQNGRKGIIQITQFVAAGEQSHIVCTIKVMKEPR